MTGIPPVRELGADEIIAALDMLAAEGEGGALAFDGDGTLWSGDIGEEAFVHACSEEMLQEVARPALERETARFGLSSEGSPSALALRLYDAWRQGRYPEQNVCEMMVYCYAGWTELEVRQHTERVLGLSTSRVVPYRALSPILDFGRRRGLRCLVISASPKLVVEVTAAALGFAAADVLGGRAAVEAGKLLPRLLEPIPYGESKATLGLALLKTRPWLATFGDNAFDFHMLRAAKLPIAVRPKTRLLDILHQLPGVAVFRE